MREREGRGDHCTGQGVRLESLFLFPSGARSVGGKCRSIASVPFHGGCGRRMRTGACNRAFRALTKDVLPSRVSPIGAHYGTKGKVKRFIYVALWLCPLPERNALLLLGLRIRVQASVHFFSLFLTRRRGKGCRVNNHHPNRSIWNSPESHIPCSHSLYTEPRKKVGTWLRDISSCPCLAFLTGPAWL